MLEAYLDPTHSEIQRMVERWLSQQGYQPSIEHRLQCGRIADVFVEVPSGVIIIECKTYLTPSIIETAWGKYARYCNYFMIAAPEADVKNAAHEKARPEWRSASAGVGFIVANKGGVDLISRPAWHLSTAQSANSGAVGARPLSARSALS